MTTSLLPIPASTGLVSFSIEVNDEVFPRHYPVFAIEVIKEINRISHACIYLADGDASTGEWKLSSETYFSPGNEISILAGYYGEDELIFSGIVISQSLKVRNSRLELKVVCKDKSIRMTTVKRSRHFVDMKDSDALNEILGEYEIPISEIATTNVIHNDLVQFDCNDWDFIVMRMEANGLVCSVDETGFSTIKPSINASATSIIRFGTNVIEFDAEIDARKQLGAVLSHSWNPSEQDYAEAESTEPTWTTNGNLSTEELAAAVGAANQFLKHGAAVSTDELQEWSDATLLRSRMAFTRGRVRVQGFSQIKPGETIQLEGFGDRFNGPVWVGAVRHEIGKGNWTTDIEFGYSDETHAQRYQTSSLPANGLLAPVHGLHVGIVTALEGDPLGELRIRIKVPPINLTDEGAWARLATMDAGNSRGSFFLPDIGDEVVVGFLNDDPRFPLILGMLHSSSHSRPEETTDDNQIRGLYSRSGMHIKFDDESTKLEILTPAGNSILLDDDAGELHLADSNNNKISMSSSGLSLESAGDLILKASGMVKVESTTELELKAGTQWKAEGAAGLEISSSAVTVIKGSLVQIN